MVQQKVIIMPISIQHDELDNIQEIRRAAGISAHVLAGDPKVFEAYSLQQFRSDMHKKFARIDKDYTAICAEVRDDAATVNWVARMASVREHLFEIDRNVPFIGRPQFNREKVSAAMGWLLAYFEASVQTIQLNERWMGDDGL